MADLTAMLAPLLEPVTSRMTTQLPPSVTEDQKIALVVAGGAVLGAAALSCICGGGSGESGGPVAATAAGAAAAVTPAAAPLTTPAKEKRRPSPLETGTPTTPRGRPSAEVEAELLGRRQQVLDEIVAVDEACVRQLEALDKHFVGERTPFVQPTLSHVARPTNAVAHFCPRVRLAGSVLEAFNATERHAIFGSTTHEAITACLGLHAALLRQLKAAVDSLGAPAAPHRTAPACR
jgi:hypothetical protein